MGEPMPIPTAFFHRGGAKDAEREDKRAKEKGKRKK